MNRLLEDIASKTVDGIFTAMTKEAERQYPQEKAKGAALS